MPCQTDSDHELAHSDDNEFEYVSCFNCPKVWKRTK